MKGIRVAADVGHAKFSGYADAAQTAAAFAAPGWLDTGDLADPAQLLAACRQRLGDPVAAPAHLTVLQQLPLTAVGKLDKVALRMLAAADTIN